jgi:hypothetical protein
MECADIRWRWRWRKPAVGTAFASAKASPLENRLNLT